MYAVFCDWCVKKIDHGQEQQWDQGDWGRPAQWFKGEMLAPLSWDGGREDGEWRDMEVFWRYSWLEL